MKIKGKKVVSLLLSVCMIMSGNGVSSLKLKDISAAETVEIKLTNGVITNADSLYEGNTINEVVLGNTSNNAVDELYMDMGTSVEFDVDTSSANYSCYLAGNANGDSLLTQSFDFLDARHFVGLDNDRYVGNINILSGQNVSICSSEAKSESVYYGKKTKKIIVMEDDKPVEKEVPIAFDVMKAELNNNHITITSNTETRMSHEKIYETYYLTFIEENGGFAWTLKIHVMFKSEVGNDAVPKKEKTYVRQGKNSVIYIEKNFAKSPSEKEIKHEIITDGYDWSVTNGNDVQSEDVIAAISTNNEGDTRFSKESSATLHAYSDRGIGNVIVTIKQNSGIMMENESNACIALTGRNGSVDVAMPVVEWIPATEINFTNEEYNLLVGSSVNLNNLIIAKGALEGINPNDEYVFTIPTSQSKYATIEADEHGTTMTLKQAGKVEVTCTAENSSVTAKCIINIFKPTTNLILSINDEIISQYQPAMAKNATVRSGNELIVTATESVGSDEDLVWNEDSWNGLLTYKLESDVDNVKVYRIKASDVTERTEVKMELSTNRTKIGNSEPGTVSTSYTLIIYPMLDGDTNLVTSVTYDGENKQVADDIDLYSGESVVVYADPEGMGSNEPIDQIEWEVTHNSAYISKFDYKALNGDNVLNATTVRRSDPDDLDEGVQSTGTATLRATSKSNPNVYKEIAINTKKSIENISLKVGDLTAPTFNVGAGGKITPKISPEDADEDIYWESEKPDYVSVDQEGNVEGLKVTGTKGVKIFAYPYHYRFGQRIMDDKPMATMVVKVKSIGSLTLDPEEAIKKYTDPRYQVSATATESGSGQQAIVDASSAKWSLSDEKVADLDNELGGSVNVTPKKVGKTEVIATIEGTEPVTGSEYLTVTAPINDSHITESAINTNTSEYTDDSYVFLPNGAKQNIVPVLTANGIDSREDSENNYVLVEGEDYNYIDSYIEGGKVGSYSIKVNGIELYTGTKEYKYKIFPKIIGDSENPDGEIHVEEVGKLIFNGVVQKPNLKIVYKNSAGEQELVLDQDYTLSNGATNAGEHTIIVKGKNNFAGEFIVNYTIDRLDLLENFGDTVKYRKGSSTEYVISGSIADQIWNGTKHEPNKDVYVCAYLNNKWTLLKEGTDYDIEFINNDHVGVASAVITGKGNYKETINCDFNIIEKNFSNSLGGRYAIDDVATFVYTGGEITPKIHMTYNDVELYEGVDYALTYSDNVNARAKSGKKATITIWGIGNFAGSTTKQFDIRPANISADPELADGLVNTEQVGELIYNGQNQVPTLDVTYKNEEGTLSLALGDDYTLSAGNKNVGENYAVTVTGKGNYTGSYVFNYSINPYDLESNFDEFVKYKVTVDGVIDYVSAGNIPNQKWNGTKVTVDSKNIIKVCAKLNGEDSAWTSLTEGTDYDVSYLNNDKVGTATAVITGKGNYKNSINDDYEIVKRELDDNDRLLNGVATVDAIEDQVYTGFEIEPKVRVLCNKVELVEGVDYELSYSNNIDTKIKSGKASVVTVTGIGNYAGSVTKEFTIVQADLSDKSLVTIDEIADQYDCGTLLTPPITVRMGEYTLINGVDYNVVYGKQNSIDYNYYKNTQGVVTITPVANGNFKAVSTTTVRGDKGNEQFFNIVEKTIYNPADTILIKQINGEDLIKNAIYVNVERSGAVNSTVKFDIESICYDGSECDDIVQAYASSSEFFSYTVTPYDSTNGNKAVLAVTGVKAGRSTITLVTQEGTTKIVDVIVNDPAISVNVNVKDAADRKIEISSAGFYSLYENHDYYFEPDLRQGKTDTVTWSVDNEEVATINEDGKLTTIKPGTVFVTVRTNPSEVSPGGVEKRVRVIVNANVLAENVFINDKVYSEQELKYGKTLELSGSALSNNGSDVTEEILWSSSDEEIVQIVSGQGTGKVVIKAVGPGSAVITYGSTLEAGVKATCKINVFNDVNSVTLSANEQALIVGNDFDLTATFNEYASDEFIWTSTNEDVVSISGNTEGKSNAQTVTITGNKPGTATITVRSATKSYVTASCTVSVVHAYAKEVFINGEKDQTIEIVKGEAVELVGTATSDYGKVTEALTWKTDNDFIAAITETSEEGKAVVTGMYAGETVISYGSEVVNGVRATVTIKVYNPVTDISFNKNINEVHIGETIDLNVSFNAFARDKMVITNSNDEVITVVPTENGVCEYQNIKVTGLKLGTSTITAKAMNSDVSDTITINVVDNLVSEATIDGEASSEKELKYDGTLTLKGSAVSETGDVTEKISWSSSNEDAVKIIEGADTDTITIKAVGPGSSVISFGSDAEGGVRAECTIKVYYEVTEIVLSDTVVSIPETVAKEITATFNEHAIDTFVWSSSDESVVVVKNTSEEMANQQTVSLEALKAGEAVITVESAKYGVVAKINVIVVANAAANVFINGKQNSSATLKLNETMELVGSANALEGDVTEKITWSTSNDKVVKIVEDDGNGKIKIKAVGAGSAVITYVSESGVKCTFTVTVPKSGETTKPSDPTKPHGTVVEGPKAGAKVSDKKYAYKVTKAGSSTTEGEVQVIGLKKKGLTTIKIAKKVTINGVTYKVTSIGNNAFKNNKKIKKAYIGNNVKTIGKNAFFGCKKLKNLVVKTKVLKKIGKKAFYRKGGKKLTIKVPGAKKKAYKKLFKRAKTNKFKIK